VCEERSRADVCQRDATSARVRTSLAQAHERAVAAEEAPEEIRLVPG
jgi:hypothetical protein